MILASARVVSSAPLRSEGAPAGYTRAWLLTGVLWLALLNPGTVVANYSLLSGVRGADYGAYWAGNSGPFSLGMDAAVLLSMPGEEEAAEQKEEPRFSFLTASLGPIPPDAPPIIWGPTSFLPVQPEPQRDDVLRGVRNWDSPYSKKFLRGTVIVTGAELTCGAVLALLPARYTKWDDDAIERGTSNFVRAWTSPPVWDSDVFFHNWLGHPYAGGFYYNMIRSQGGTVWQSVKFTIFQTLMWEYVIEAVAEQPSIQDLIMTPIAGSLLGELFHRWSVAILKKGSLNFGQKALVFFLNPSYVINNGFRMPE